MIPLLIKKDKWLQYCILRNGSSLAGRLPDTQLFKKYALTKMLLQYQSVVLKPRDGSYGRDIVFIKRNGAKSYRIHNEKNAVTMKDTDRLLQWLREKKQSAWIYCPKTSAACSNWAQAVRHPNNGSAKKGSSSTWNVTGSYAKVAAQGYLVRNVASRSIPVLEALKLARIGDRNLLVKAEGVALLAAKQLGERTFVRWLRGL